MDHLNSLSAYGAHPKDFEPEQVKPVLSNLAVVIRWYLKYKGTKVIEEIRPGENKTAEELPLVDAASKEKELMHDKPFGLTDRKWLFGIAFLAIIIMSTVFVYPRVFKKDKLENLISSDGRISIAVMPFRNMTNDTIWNVWQDGIKDNLITYLSNYSEDLTVKQPESVNNLLQSRGLTNYASLTPSIAGTISRNLDANVFISGSISQAGSKIRVNAQLINSKTEDAFKSFQIEGTFEEDIFRIIDSLSVLVKDFLIISVMEKEIVTDFRPLISTRSSEAYRD
jgi:TolB-like protein